MTGNTIGAAGSFERRPGIGGFGNGCPLDVLAPFADASVPRERQPRHMNRVIPANRDAVLLTSASVRVRKHGNAIRHDQRFGAASFDTQTAPCAVFFKDSGNPLLRHW